MAREQFPTSCTTADGRWIAGGFTEKVNDSVAVWNAHTGQLLWEKMLEARLVRVETDSATHTLAAEYLSGEPLRYSVALFDLRTGQRRATVTPASDSLNGLSPSFTAKGHLLIQSETQLEWRSPLTGKLLSARNAPQGGTGYLLTNQGCGRFRVVEYTNTNPVGGIIPGETQTGLEVISEKEGILQGVLLKENPLTVRYNTYPAKELIAVLLTEGSKARAQMFHVPTRALLAEKAISILPEDDALGFSPDGSLLYIGAFKPQVWQWWTGGIRQPRHHEVREFSTFYLGRREVYHQYWDGAVRDAQTDKLVVLLRPR